MDKNELTNSKTDNQEDLTIRTQKPRKTTTKLKINNNGETVEAVMFNEPLLSKNNKKVAKNSNNPAQNDDNVDFFDATIDFEPEQKTDIQTEIERARQRAIQEKEILERTKNAPDNSRKTFVSCVIACLVSTGILLALTIVFFLALRWYGVGLGFAIITIVVAQVWISFFKRMNKKLDIEEPIDNDEIELQNKLKEKYGNDISKQK